MADMIDPMEALTSLQAAINNGHSLNQCELDPSISVVVDQPNGITRFSYVRIEQKVVKALSLFAAVEPIDGIACFAIGYAVPSSHRNKGLATEIVEKGIAELGNGLGRNGVNKLYIEAIVGKENIASQKVSSKTISTEFYLVVDDCSGKDAFRYLRLVECTQKI